MVQKRKKSSARRVVHSFESSNLSQTGYTKDDLEHFFGLIYDLVETSSELCTHLISLRKSYRGSQVDWTGDEKATDLSSMEQAENVVAQPALWTIPQVSEAMQVSRAKIYQLIAQEGLPVIRFGRTVRVSPVELQQWIKQRGIF